MQIVPRKSHRSPVGREERGTILVAAVLIIFLVMVIVADASLVANVEWEATRNADLDLRLEYAIKGGFELAKCYLVDDADNAGDVDSLLEEWAQPEGIERDFNPNTDWGGSSSENGDGHPKVTITIEDEDRKWPLTMLLAGSETNRDRRKEQLANVLDEFRKGTNFDLDPGMANSYADAILRFVTRKENDTGFGPTPRPLTKSGGLINITDLALIPSIPRHVIFDLIDDDNEGTIVPGLINYLTLWSDNQINVNTASEPVLRGLFRRDESDASVGSTIFHKREERSNKFVEDEARESGGTQRDRFERERKRRQDESRNPAAPGAPGTTPPSSGRSSQPGTGRPNSPESEEEFSGVFNTVEDVKKEVNTLTDRLFGEISSFMTVTSKTFTIFVEAKVHGVRKSRRFIVRREGPRFVLILSEPVTWPRYRPPPKDGL